jgi:hypothetical protein
MKAAMHVPLNTLTETQILSDIRKAFAGQTLEGIDVDALIASSLTLEELIATTREIIADRDAFQAGGHKKS